MNAIVPTTGNTALTPTSMESAIQLAEMMARGKLVPSHLHNSPGDCLMVIEASMRWQMSPFAVAQCTSVIQGKLMFEGKLVAAALNASGILSTRLDYDFSGDGAQRAVTVRATLKGETKAREVTVFLAEAKTSNGMWTKQPDQQLVYAGTRVWARRHAPEVMLGVYAPEEFDRADAFTGPTIEPDARDAMNADIPLKAAAAATPRGARIAERAPSYEASPDTPRPRTRRDFLDGLAIALRDATGPEEVDRLLCGEEVMRAKEAFTNGHKAELEKLIGDALKKWWTEPPLDEMEIAGEEKMASGDF
jgi:hypothetical protein